MTDREMKMRVAQEASNWWSDIITSPKFDIGADNVEAMFAEAIATINVKPISGNSIKCFREELYNNIMARIENISEGMSIIYDIDYAPDRNLKEIAEHCNIPESNFPLKTTMWVYKDAVVVRYGYGANREYIYDSASYWRWKLTDVEEGIKYWENKGEKEIADRYKADIPNIKTQLEICINRDGE